MRRPSLTSRTRQTGGLFRSPGSRAHPSFGEGAEGSKRASRCRAEPAVGQSEERVRFRSLTGVAESVFATGNAGCGLSARQNAAVYRDLEDLAVSGGPDAKFGGPGVAWLALVSRLAWREPEGGDDDRYQARPSSLAMQISSAETSGLSGRSCLMSSIILAMGFSIGTMRAAGMPSRARTISSPCSAREIRCDNRILASSMLTVSGNASRRHLRYRRG